MCTSILSIRENQNIFSHQKSTNTHMQGHHAFCAFSVKIRVKFAEINLSGAEAASKLSFPHELTGTCIKHY
jgi:hypothetical protein